MTIYGPACTCPPVDKPIPHNAGCPRFDEHRVWSIEDRAECSASSTETEEVP